MIKTTPYDKDQVYQEKVAPLVATVMALCKEHRIPFFFAAATRNTEQDTVYATECLSALPMNLALTDDKIVDHLKICSGFRAIVPETIPDIEL